MVHPHSTSQIVFSNPPVKVLQLYPSLLLSFSPYNRKAAAPSRLRDPLILTPLLPWRAQMPPRDCAMMFDGSSSFNIPDCILKPSSQSASTLSIANGARSSNETNSEPLWSPIELELNLSDSSPPDNVPFKPLCVQIESCPVTKSCCKWYCLHKVEQNSVSKSFKGMTFKNLTSKISAEKRNRQTCVFLPGLALLPLIFVALSSL
ncbi:hypothetical protein AAZV13_13G080000 [Glycine max]